MRFLYTSDLHGDTNKYQELLKLAVDGNYKTIILGGDLFPKHCEISEQSKFVDGYLRDFFGILQSLSINCCCILGNDDFEPARQRFAKMSSEFPNIHNIDRAICNLEDCDFIGLSTVLDHPFTIKNNVALEKRFQIESQRGIPLIYKNGEYSHISEDWESYANTNLPRMETLLNNLPSPDTERKCIYVFHMPPQNVKLGMLRSGVSLGSNAIYEFLLDKQPYMSLHGHIHESPTVSGVWKANIGQTVAIQGGQTEYGQKGLFYTSVDTKKNLILRHETGKSTLQRTLGYR